MKCLLLFIALFFSLSVKAYEDFTIYLVRHAEKQKSGKDPELTLCGLERAAQLAKMLSQAKIEKVYSTNYKRTNSTATPTAKSLTLDVTLYEPRNLTEFAQELLSAGKNSLVVGHSNTTPQLVSLLIDQKVNEITEKDFSNLYVVQVSEDRKSLSLLTQPHACKKAT